MYTGRASVTSRISPASEKSSQPAGNAKMEKVERFERVHFPVPAEAGPQVVPSQAQPPGAGCPTALDR